MPIRRAVIAFAAFAARCLTFAAHLGAQHPTDQSGVGIVHFPNSGAASAQAPFLRGIAQLHNFEYDQAARAFEQAERADPNFALPYWFEAFTHSAVLWAVDDTSAAHAVLARLGATPAARLAKAATPRERAYAAAVEAFYADTTLTVRAKAFADSLSLLAQRDTTDLEASAFAALGNLMYASQYDISGSAHDASTRRTIAFAERV